MIGEFSSYVENLQTKGRGYFVTRTGGSTSALEFSVENLVSTTYPISTLMPDQALGGRRAEPVCCLSDCRHALHGDRLRDSGALSA